MKKILMMVVIGSLVFNTGCTTTKYKKTHVGMTGVKICLFEKFTQEEKAMNFQALCTNLFTDAVEQCRTLQDAIDALMNDVGSRIARNQDGCVIDRDSYNGLIIKHNKAHAND